MEFGNFFKKRASNLYKNTKGVAYQVNPFDFGKTFNDAHVPKFTPPPPVDKNKDLYYAISRPRPLMRMDYKKIQPANSAGVPALPQMPSRARMSNDVGGAMAPINQMRSNRLQVKPNMGMQPFGQSFEDASTPQGALQPARRPQTTKNSVFLSPEQMRMYVLQKVFKSLFR